MGVREMRRKEVRDNRSKNEGNTKGKRKEMER